MNWPRAVNRSVFKNKFLQPESGRWRCPPIPASSTQHCFYLHQPVPLLDEILHSILGAETYQCISTRRITHARWRPSNLVICKFSSVAYKCFELLSVRAGRCRVKASTGSFGMQNDVLESPQTKSRKNRVRLFQTSLLFVHETLDRGYQVAPGPLSWKI